MSDDFGLWDVIVSIFWFTLLLSWISLLIHIIADIFRDRGLGGAAKAGWTLFIVLVPWLGALFYIFSRGDSMNERAHQAALDEQARLRAYVGVSPSSHVSDELRGLTELRDNGVLTPDEYDRAKAKILG